MFTFGSCTSDGRNGSSVSGVALPTKIKTQFKKLVTKISCGFSHSLCITADGLLWDTGKNDFG